MFQAISLRESFLLIEWTEKDRRTRGRDTASLRCGMESAVTVSQVRVSGRTGDGKTERIEEFHVSASGERERERKTGIQGYRENGQKKQDLRTGRGKKTMDDVDDVIGGFCVGSATHKTREEMHRPFLLSRLSIFVRLLLHLFHHLSSSDRDFASSSLCLCYDTQTVSSTSFAPAVLCSSRFLLDQRLMLSCLPFVRKKRRK